MKNELVPTCPVRKILSKVCDKWSLLILYELEIKGIMRFGELQKSIPDISQKMLTSTLKTLYNLNLVHREVYPVVPPKTEYQLTEAGKKLMPNIYQLMVWAKDNYYDLTLNKPDKKW